MCTPRCRRMASPWKSKWKFPVATAQITIGSHVVSANSSARRGAPNESRGARWIARCRRNRGSDTNENWNSGATTGRSFTGASPPDQQDTTRALARGATVVRNASRGNGRAGPASRTPRTAHERGLDWTRPAATCESWLPARRSRRRPARGGCMVGLLLRLRWLAVVVALFGALNAIAFIAIGAVRAFEAYRMIALGPPWTGDHAPGVVLARSVDAFLLAMVFLVFAIGVMTLFLSRDAGHGFENIPEWMRVKSLSELKFVIWEAILAAV